MLMLLDNLLAYCERRLLPLTRRMQVSGFSPAEVIARLDCEWFSRNQQCLLTLSRFNDTSRDCKKNVFPLAVLEAVMQGRKPSKQEITGKLKETEEHRKPEKSILGLSSTLRLTSRPTYCWAVIALNDKLNLIPIRISKLFGKIQRTQMRDQLM